ncbi:MFS general substrate transporter [Wallemia mellicola]|uniref:Arginine biosynthesis bifunctional protein ArgJ, mitochondrial n=1 Tax=Wallemia mellicola TaxID=1708541 RepID=A0A4T0P491_9BASI|nr:MFS general substrate transporter [Wallemia mellicola]
MDFVDFSDEIQRRPSTLSGLSSTNHHGQNISEHGRSLEKPRRSGSIKPKNLISDSEDGTLAAEEVKEANAVERREEDIEKGDESGAKEEPRTETDPFLVEFTPNDPDNPKNWKTWYKWHCTMLSSLLILNSTLASSIPTSAMPLIMAEFNVDQEVAILQITLFLLGYVIGTFRCYKHTFLINDRTNCVSTIFRNTRLITGTAAASPLTNSGGVLTDIWTIDKLGIPMSCFSVAPFLGPVLGPILGGFEAQYANVGSSKNWQWVYYTCLIFGFVCFLMVVFLLPETYGPTILEKRVKKLRKEHKDDRYYCSSMKNRPPIGELLKVSLTRPIRLQFTEPIIIFSSIYVSIVYGVLYISFEMFPLVFQGVHHMSVSMSGLSFISIAIGIAFFLVVTIIFDKRFRKVAMQTGKVPPPELRLEPTMWIGSFAFAISLWWFAWTSYDFVPWQAPMVRLKYLASTYVTFSASALASNTIARSIVGAVCPLFVEQMFDGMTIKWAGTLLAAVATVLCIALAQDTLPRAFRVGATHSGVKKNGALDLGILHSTTARCTSAASFTQNVFKAAPVVWSSEVLQKGNGTAKALIVNSGCANAVTGQQGLKDAQTMSAGVDEMLKEKDSTLVMSTGVIGQLLPIKKITDSIAPLFNATKEDGESWMSLAKAFMTTDTFPKLRAKTLSLPSGRNVRVAGIDKGAGMIHPHMGPPSSIPRLPHGTLLGVIATDAPVASADLQSVLDHAVDRSFNSISVDGDMSTNDTILAFANGAEGGSQLTGEDLASFKSQLTDFAIELAQLVVRDGEGATKFVTVNVENAPSYAVAQVVARTVATSSLVKTALYGQDANWGRILCAVGYAPLDKPSPINPSKVTVKFRPTDGSPDIALLTNGEPEQVDEARAAEVLKLEDLDIRIDLGQGTEKAQYWTCDLSHVSHFFNIQTSLTLKLQEYVTINGEYVGSFFYYRPFLTPRQLSLIDFVLVPCILITFRRKV